MDVRWGIQRGMDETGTLIIGAGATGLSYANFTSDPDYLVLEADSEVGGYCKTIKQDGFVWDYSGHFFHFRRPEIESYLVSRMPKDCVKTIARSSKCLFKDCVVDFPFQKNIHQLPKADFIDCLYDLYFREQEEFSNFQEMLFAKFGRGICERFLIPYNEKLYACDLSDLDVDAMGRFFPYADVDDVIRNFRAADNASYNTTFSYPEGGAIEYIQALLSEIPEERVCLNERLLGLDLERRVATTSRREIGYQRVVSSAPFNTLLSIAEIEHDSSVFSSNKVLIFNLGFDKKGWEGLHWLYVCERKYSFYRVGFYDNIFDHDRMSLYIEIGMPTDAPVDQDASLKQVLADLATAGVVTDHQLVSHHTVVLDPAYVHITKDSQAQFTALSKRLNEADVYSIGRYGGWTYCSIEDNIIEAIDLVTAIEGVAPVL
jgi:protoporphyrinogen oxidase